MLQRLVNHSHIRAELAESPTQILTSACRSISYDHNHSPHWAEIAEAVQTHFEYSSSFQLEILESLPEKLAHSSTLALVYNCSKFETDA